MIELTGKIKLLNTSSIINVNRKNLSKVDIKIVDRDDVTGVSYGIVSNGGSFDINDHYGEVLQYLKNGVLESGNGVSFYLKSGSQEQKFIEDWEVRKINYDNANKVVSVNISDKLEEWQNITVGKIDFDPRSTVVYTMRSLYEYLYSFVPTDYKMQPFSELDTNLKTILLTTDFGYYQMPEGNLWSKFDMFCKACLCVIYHDGFKTVCKYIGAT